VNIGPGCGPARPRARLSIGSDRSNGHVPAHSPYRVHCAVCARPLGKGGAMSRYYDVVERETAYYGYFRIVRYRVRHSLFNGGSSAILNRERFERGHSVGVLPYDPARDAVLLVEQFRIGALEASQGPWLIETVAGIIEPGESSEQVAYRELQEEAG